MKPNWPASSRGATAWARIKLGALRGDRSRPRQPCRRRVGARRGRWARPSNQALALGAQLLALQGGEACGAGKRWCQVSRTRCGAAQAPQSPDGRRRGGLMLGLGWGRAGRSARRPSARSPQKCWSPRLKREVTGTNTSEALAAGMAGAQTGPPPFFFFSPARQLALEQAGHWKRVRALAGRAHSNRGSRGGRNCACTASRGSARAEGFHPLAASQVTLQSAEAFGAQLAGGRWPEVNDVPISAGGPQPASSSRSEATTSSCPSAWSTRIWAESCAGGTITGLDRFVRPV